MLDWMQDPDVRQARQAYELARGEWLESAASDQSGGSNSSLVQHESFVRMKAADWAYVWARDNAIDRCSIELAGLAAASW
jgi:hypothetical protein